MTWLWPDCRVWEVEATVVVQRREDCQATRHSFRAQSHKAPKKLSPPKSYRCATWIWSIVMCITPPWTIKKSRNVRGRLWAEQHKISHKKVSTALQHDDVRIRGSVASGGGGTKVWLRDNLKPNLGWQNTNIFDGKSWRLRPCWWR